MADWLLSLSRIWGTVPRQFLRVATNQPSVTPDKESRECLGVLYAARTHPTRSQQLVGSLAGWGRKNPQEMPMCNVYQ